MIVSKKSKLFLYGLALLAVVLSAVGRAGAETRCSTEVSYKWRPKDGQEDITVLFQVVFYSAQTEEDARAELGMRAKQVQQRGMVECRRLHETTADCLVQRYRSAESSLTSSSFATRRALEQSFIDDCKRSVGTCSLVEPSSPVCIATKVEVTPTPTATVEPTPAEAEKKDKKKGKK